MRVGINVLTIWINLKYTKNETKRERERERETDRQTDRQTDRDRETERERERPHKNSAAAERQTNVQHQSSCAHV